MTWREASDHVDYLHRNIKSSVLLPLYGVADRLRGHDVGRRPQCRSSWLRDAASVERIGLAQGLL
jgi:hypothetical protein